MDAWASGLAVVTVKCDLPLSGHEVRRAAAARR